MEYLVLSQSWGGLGDNLQFSTLPELYHNNTKKEIFLSSNNSVRNKEIKEIVWDKNPFIKGIKDEPGNIGSNLFGSIPKSAWDTECNIIKKWELVHGFKSDDNYPRPKIYYKPKVIKEYSNKIVADLTSITTSGNYNGDVLKKIIGTKYDKDNFYILRPQSKDIPQPMFEHQTINFANVFEYADIISSCKKFVCLYSGSMVLAAAIKNNNIHCYFPPHSSYTLEQQKPYFYFDNVEYFETL